MRNGNIDVDLTFASEGVSAYLRINYRLLPTDPFDFGIDFTNLRQELCW